MVVIPLQRSIRKIREEVTERDIDPADIPFGTPGQLYHHHHHRHPGKHLSNGGSLSGSSYSSSSRSTNKMDSDSESDSCFSEEEEDGEDDEGTHGGGEEYPVHYRRYSESVTLTERPSYQRRHYGMEWVIQDRRRFREEVQIQLGAKPTTVYSTTTQCFINSKFRWYRDAVYIMPKAASAASPKRFTTTVFVFPKFPRKNVVSSLEHHTAKTIKWYKVSMELEARDFVSIKLVHLS